MPCSCVQTFIERSRERTGRSSGRPVSFLLPLRPPPPPAAENKIRNSNQSASCIVRGRTCAVLICFVLLTFYDSAVQKSELRCFQNWIAWIWQDSLLLSFVSVTWWRGFCVFLFWPGWSLLARRRMGASARGSGCPSARIWGTTIPLCPIWLDIEIRKKRKKRWVSLKLFL